LFDVWIIGGLVPVQAHPSPQYPYPYPSPSTSPQFNNRPRHSQLNAPRSTRINDHCYPLPNHMFNVIAVPGTELAVQLTVLIDYAI